MLTHSQRAAELVETSIAPELLPVWKRVARFIVATPYASRLEVFEEWVAEHAGDVADILEASDAAAVRATIRGELDAYAVDAGEPGDRIALDFHEGWLETPVSEDASPRAHTSFIDVSSLAF